MIYDRQYNWYTQVNIGETGIDKLGSTIKADGAHKVLIHFGSGDYLYSTGVMQRVEDSLKEAGLEYYKLGGVVPNGSIALVREGVELVREKGIDYIVSIGGGSVVDSAKTIGLCVAYDGDPWDLFSFKNMNNLSPDADVVPVAAVVTYPATGAECGNSAVLKNRELLEKKFTFHPKLRPRFAYLDPRYTLTLPRWNLVNGIADMFIHFMDSYWTTDAHFGIFDNLLESAMRYIQHDLAPTILDPEKDNIVDRKELMAAANMGVNDWIAWARKKENGSHQIAHPIGALYDTIHGSTLSIFYCDFIRFFYKENLQRAARWAERVWDVEYDPNDLQGTADKGIECLHNWFVELGMPTKFSDLGLNPTDAEIDTMAEQAVTVFGGDHIGVIKPIYKQDVIDILNLAR